MCMSRDPGSPQSPESSWVLPGEQPPGLCSAPPRAQLPPCRVPCAHPKATGEPQTSHLASQLNGKESSTSPFKGCSENSKPVLGEACAARGISAICRAPLPAQRTRVPAASSTRASCPREPSPAAQNHTRSVLLGSNLSSTLHQSFVPHHHPMGAVEAFFSPRLLSHAARGGEPWAKRPWFPTRTLFLLKCFFQWFLLLPEEIEAEWEMDTNSYFGEGFT